MVADVEVIGVSRLYKHAKNFHKKGAAAVMELANVEKTNIEKNVEDLNNDETEEDDTKNSTAGNNMEEEDDDENTKDAMKGSNDNELADSSEKDVYVIGGDSKSSNPLDSGFAVSSPPTMADISEGVDTMKDNWGFDDLEDGISEEQDILDRNKGKTEELADDNEKARDMEDKITNRKKEK